MTVRFVVPSSWHNLTELTELTCECETARVGDAITWFFTRYPHLRKRILDEEGDIAPWAMVGLDRVDVRTVGGLDTVIDSGNHEIELMGALMGG